MSYSSTRIPAEFVGVDQATLQQWLTDAQNAQQQLVLGRNVQVASYAQGAGTKSITYTPADLPALTQRINKLAQALGLVQCARRAIGFRF